MDQKQEKQIDQQDDMNMNIKQFLEATRQYLFELAAPQPALIAIPVRADR